MPRVVNADTSSSQDKRPYRKGNALSPAEKKRMSVSRKKETHKEVNVFIRNEYKEILLQLCKDAGMTQADMFEKWIEDEKAKK